MTLEEVSESVDTDEPANIRHLEECGLDDCDRCDYLLEFYAACDDCHHFGNMSAMFNDGDGKTYCQTCFERRESRGKTQ